MDNKKILKKTGLDVVPDHVAIIMDGNGRWAQKRGLPRIMGHRKGADKVREIVKVSGELGIKTLTLYAFSDENWGRPKNEISALMNLLNNYLLKEQDELNKNNVRLQAIGNLEKLPEKSQRLLSDVSNHLSNNTGLILNLALSYGSRSEISKACREIAQKVLNKSIDISEINPDLINKHLYEQNEIDFLIRTSGELRISNFLLWQIAYAELYFADVFWPDFSRDIFIDILKDYQKRQRRFGKL